MTRLLLILHFTGLVMAFAATFAIFLERAFEQVRNSVARQDLNVKLLGSHAGIHTGEDGSSAQAIEDIAIYRALPNMKIVVPADAVEAEQATIAAAQIPGPFYIRVNRNETDVVYEDGCRFELGRGSVLRDGRAAAVIACGTLVGEALAAAAALERDGIDVRVVNMSSIKPLDADLVVACAEETGLVVTAEDHNVIGGLGSAVAEVLCERCPARLVRIGMQDRFGDSGDPAGLYRKYGLDAARIADRVRRELGG